LDRVYQDYSKLKVGRFETQCIALHITISELDRNNARHALKVSISMNTQRAAQFISFKVGVGEFVDNRYTCA